jgi:uncharacterized membrane protein YcaP (DUF421 family)
MPFPTEIILRSIIVYVFILGAIRLFGKKELSQLSIFDLVLILLISNSVQNAMVGPDNSLIGGLVAAASLFIANYLLGLLIYKNKKIGKFLQGNPVLLVHDGKVIENNLKKEQITISEIEQAAREHGVESLSDVNLAILEIDGSISILSNNYQKQTRRKHRIQRTIMKKN